mmetsp:Transcript_766/g.842  ORF Transcript_766/g.842 Transcript_766/m.842 type:complete len:165 (-) Transcript_766:334-828(-)
MLSRHSIFVAVWTLLLLTIGLTLKSTNAFTTSMSTSSSNFHKARTATTTTTTTTTVIFSTPPEREESDPFADPLRSRTSSSEVITTKYPINLPSPVLLASSMILAIIGTGCGFDIFSDSPRFGVAINASIATSGLILCLGLFYASILKAQAETEEDDENYMNGR